MNQANSINLCSNNVPPNVGCSNRKPDPKYPIYRKFKSGVEWQKITSPSAAIHITTRGTWWNLSFESMDERLIADVMNDADAEPCTRDEWEKMYHNAQYILSQINTVQ